MPIGNDVINLLGLAPDKFLESALIVGDNLNLTMNNGDVITVDLSAGPDVFLSGAVIDLNDILTLTMNDGVTHVLDLSSYRTADTYVQSGAIDGLTGLVTLTLNDASVVTFNISGYVENAEIIIQSASYNCALNQIEITSSDGAVVAVDMTCFIDYMATQERGGVAYSATTTYVAGDVATASGQAYVSLTGSSASPINNPSDWAPINIEEKAGQAWDGTFAYSVGDMVTKGNLIYISQAPSTGVDPVGNPVQWREYNSVWHTAESGGSIANAMHNPTVPAINTYPDNAAETLGAMWYVDGLGAGNTYTFTVGGLSGITVKDGDKIVWGSGALATPSWIFLPTPTISVERGGVLWSSALDYLVGDIVTAPNGTIYRCKADITANPTLPNIDTANWLSEGRTGVYDSTTIYEGGDIISYGDNVYIAPVGGIGPNVIPPTAGWILSTTDERGGVAYDAGTAYSIGDMVTEGGVAYVAASASTGSTPSLTPAVWTIPVDPNAVERGGVAWNVAINFLAGDAVTSSGNAYLALIDNVGFLPDNNPTQWKLLTKESGGIAHDATTLYIKGDVVTEKIGTVETMFIAKIANDGVLPSSSSVTWEMVISATTYTENGGTEWLPTTAYNAGDITVEFAGSVPLAYVALVPNINDLPSLNLTTIWQLVVPTERGGRDWKLNLEYLVGDLVVEAGIVYQSILANTGVAPAGDPLTWQIVDKAGSLWSVGTTYEIGDLVTEDGTTYIALLNSTGVSPATDPLTWQAVNGSGEYDSGINYNSGDIVSEGGVVYVAIADNVGTAPGVTPLSWQPVDKGGTLWDATTNYAIGDVATKFDKAYVAKTANVNSSPTQFGDTADWKLDVVTVEDVLTSTSAINALSANMGKTLEDNKIEATDYGTSSTGGTAKFVWDAGTQTLNIVTV